MTADCQLVVTPEGLARECVDPDLRTISYEYAPRQLAHKFHRIVAGQHAIEAEGFTLAWERPL